MLILSVEQVTGTENIKRFEDFKVDPEVKYSDITILSESTLISNDKISEIMTCLEVHGKLTIKYQRDVKASDAETEMKLCGLLSVVSKEEAEGQVVVEGIKPDLSIGAGQRRPIKKPSKDALKAFLSSDASTNNLIDDSSLLKEEDLVKPVGGAVEGEECGPKAKKKACKNCSCGLKEIEEAEAAEKKQEQEVIDTTNVKSSCGSVRKGSIFTFIYFLFSVI